MSLKTLAITAAMAGAAGSGGTFYAIKPTQAQIDAQIAARDSLRILEAANEEESLDPQFLGSPCPNTACCQNPIFMQRVNTDAKLAIRLMLDPAFGPMNYGQVKGLLYQIHILSKPLE